MNDLQTIITNPLIEIVKNAESEKECSTPLKTRLKTNRLKPVIESLSDDQLKALFIVLSSDKTIKAAEYLYQGRYASIQKYIISKEILIRLERKNPDNLITDKVKD